MQIRELGLVASQIAMWCWWRVRLSEVGGGVAVGGREGSREAHSPFTDGCPLGKLREALVQQRRAASQNLNLSPHSGWRFLLMHREKTIKSRPHQPALDRHNTSLLRTRSLPPLAILRG